MALAIVWFRFECWGRATNLQLFLGQSETVRHLLMATTVVGLWNVWLSLSAYERRTPRKDLLAEIGRLNTASIGCGVPLFLWGIAGRSLMHGLEVAYCVTAALVGLSLASLGGFLLAAVFSPQLHRKRGAIMVGTGRRAGMLKDKLLSHAFPIELYGCVDDQFVGKESDRASYLGPISCLAQLLKTHPIELVLIGLPMRSKYDEIQRVVEICETVGVESHHMQDIFDTELARIRVNVHAPEDFHVLSTSAQKPTQHIKRLMDFIGAMVLLILLSPVLLAATLAIRLTSPGPVFFVQERYGIHRKRFPMYKFRSMVKDAESKQAALESLNEAQGPVFKMKRDPRVTPIGAFLRKTSIDELPQLLNVIRGEMSLVGPRPLPLRDVSRFEDAWLLRRFSVRPGLTGIWQVTGRSNTTFDSWIRLDLEYIDRWSLSLDLSILFRTIPAVLRGSGAV